MLHGCFRNMTLNVGVRRNCVQQSVVTFIGVGPLLTLFPVTPAGADLSRNVLRWAGSEELDLKV